MQSGDYSYGIYLYGFPITQVLATEFSALRTNIFALIFAAIICTGLFAALSWHLVEKRFLRLRKYFSVQSSKVAEELHPEIDKERKGMPLLDYFLPETARDLRWLGEKLPDHFVWKWLRNGLRPK